MTTRLRDLKGLFAVTMVATVGTTAIAVADPNLPDIGEHRHYVQNSQGMVEVGPRLCDNPKLQKAFNQFHSNVHFAVSGSPGPEHSAPGLHNMRGAEVTSRGCDFVPPQQ